MKSLSFVGQKRLGVDPLIVFLLQGYKVSPLFRWADSFISSFVWKRMEYEYKLNGTGLEQLWSSSMVCPCLVHGSSVHITYIRHIYVIYTTYISHIYKGMWYVCGCYVELMSNDYFINGRAMDEPWTNHGRRSELFQTYSIRVMKAENRQTTPELINFPVRGYTSFRLIKL